MLRLLQILSISLLHFPLISFGQQFLEWSAYTSMREATRLFVNADFVWVATSGGVFSSGCEIKNRLSERVSAKAYSTAIRAASIYFSAWIGEINNVSAALSKPFLQESSHHATVVAVGPCCCNLQVYIFLRT